MPETATFGSRIKDLGPREAVAAEAEEGRRGHFAELDALMDDLLAKTLRGKRVLKLDGGPGRDPVEVRLPLRSEADTARLDAAYLRANQERNGAWYVPDQVSLSVGIVELAYWSQQDPRHLVNIANDQRVEVVLQSAPAVAAWSLLEPAVDALALPLRLRADRWAGRAGKPFEASKLKTNWEREVVGLYSALGLDLEPLQPFALGQWGSPRAAEVIARRQQLIASWSEVGAEQAQCLRAWQVGKLVTRYYAKAKNGTAKRATVLNDRVCERVLSAYFAGDWLAFLDYLGEQPHDDEEVIRSLPQASLLAASSARASTAAAAAGVGDEELARILAAYWNQGDTESPLEQRVRTLTEFWRQFDAIHARQEPEEHPKIKRLGMGHLNYTFEPAEPLPDGHLAGDLAADINRMWKTTVNARFPERLITQPSPEAAATAAIGPAFEFWQRVGFGAYNACEYEATTSLKEFEASVRRQTEALVATGFAPDPQMFTELVAAEKQLGLPQETWHQVSEEKVEFITVTMGVSGPTRRDGFDILRDIITRYRRAWTSAHLDAYLEARWRADLGSVSEAYHRQAAVKGKPPTLKQFAKLAAPAAGSWFGGDVAEVYNVLGLPSPMQPPVYERLLPLDLRAFHRAIRAGISARVPEKTGGERQSQKQREGRLAALGMNWVRLTEAIGVPPALRQFGSSEFKLLCVDLADDVEEAYVIYSDIVAAALAAESLATTTPEASTAPAAGSPRPAFATPTRGVALGSEPKQVERRHGWLRRLVGR